MVATSPTSATPSAIRRTPPSVPNAASISIVTLLDKPSRREKPIYPDLAGFEVPDEFVVGFGLDYCQQYRNMPYIGVLKPGEDSK